MNALRKLGIAGFFVLLLSAGLALAIGSRPVTTDREKALDVNSVSADPSAYKGTIQVRGVVSKVSPSDSTFVLAAALARGMSGILTGYYWDPLAIRFCEEAGEGAKLRLRIGGKCGVESGDPLDLRVTVRRILPGGVQSFGDATMSMGTVVWLSEEGGIDHHDEPPHPLTLEGRDRGVLDDRLRSHRGREELVDVTNPAVALELVVERELATTRAVPGVVADETDDRLVEERHHLERGELVALDEHA